MVEHSSDSSRIGVVTLVIAVIEVIFVRNQSEIEPLNCIVCRPLHQSRFSDALVPVPHYGNLWEWRILKPNFQISTPQTYFDLVVTMRAGPTMVLGFKNIVPADST